MLPAPFPFSIRAISVEAPLLLLLPPPPEGEWPTPGREGWLIDLFFQMGGGDEFAGGEG